MELVEFCDSGMGFRFPKSAMWQCRGFESAETAVVNRLAEYCQLFVDVGANNGLYSMIAFKRGLRVIAVEPSPENLYYLCRTCLENGAGDVEVLGLALGAKVTILELHGRGVLASLDEHWAVEHNKNPLNRPTLVPVNTLDNVVRGRCVNRDRALIKVDVEGTEWEVLRGSRECLDMRPGAVWLMEITLVAKRQVPNVNFERTFGPFFERSYRVYGVTEKSIRQTSREDVARWQESGSQEFYCQNWMFLPPDLPACDVEKLLQVRA